MVNRGPSKACLTCKARRIRCDEGRPACKKCAKSQRTCLGYSGVQNALNELRASPGGAVSKWPGQSTVVTSRLPISTLSPLALGPDQDAREAFAKFFSDFVVESKDPVVTRGYFDGLEDLLAKSRSGSNSDLYRATRLVALANASRGAGTRKMAREVELYYADTLKSFQKSLSSLDERDSDEAIMTASLLGLYEMMVATEACSDGLSAHVTGVSAIIYGRSRESDFVPGKALFWWLNILPRSVLDFTETPSGPLSLAYPAAAGHSSHSLDMLMLRMRPTLLQAYDTLANPEASKVDLRRLKKQVILLNKEFSLWPMCQPSQWMPKTIGHIERETQYSGIALDDMPFWPGPIDSYYDLYVAAVWDTYRKCRLKLFQVAMNCATRLEQKDSSLLKVQGEIQNLVDGMCASVPFQLCASIEALPPREAIHLLQVPGRPVGGLLLMYPLYIASTLSIVPSDQRAWMKGRLRWIGEHMGIGQATVLGTSDLVPHLAVADGHALVLSGSLISRTG